MDKRKIRKKALFVVKPPPRNAIERDWQGYVKRNQKWMSTYFAVVYLEIGLIVALAYLLHIFIFSKP